MNAKPTSPASDNTRDRIRAFIHSLRPLSGVADMSESDEYQRGRALIERLADSAQGTKNPELRLTPEQCAQVCEYLSSIEPFDPANWWDDPPDATSHVCGFHAVVDALAASLRQHRPVTPIRPKKDDSREVAAAQIREVMDQLRIFATALKASECDVAQAVGRRLDIDGLHNELDVARELLEEGRPARGEEAQS